MTDSAWREYRLHLGMPHLQPGRLAEEAVLKHLGAFAWQTVAELAGQRENAVVNDEGERLHPSMIGVELGMPAGRGWEEFDEGTDLRFRHRAGVFGRKLVEGLFLFDKDVVPDAELAAVGGREDLSRGPRPWAYLTHGFVTRSPGTWVKLDTPAAFMDRPLPELATMPAGVIEHPAVERTGAIEGFLDWAGARVLRCGADEDAFDYEVDSESDYNAAGVVYCARMPAIMATGERRLLRERMQTPWSELLVACLATEHRRIYYFSNASRETRLRMRVEARFCPASPTAPGRPRILGRVFLRTDLHRASDGVLMASSLVGKVLRVPGQAKPLLSEMERWLARLEDRG
jgi:probable biosynthetic protein (TIGR04098 family)